MRHGWWHPCPGTQTCDAVKIGVLFGGQLRPSRTRRFGCGAATRHTRRSLVSVLDTSEESSTGWNHSSPRLKTRGLLSAGPHAERSRIDSVQAGRRAVGDQRCAGTAGPAPGGTGCGYRVGIPSASSRGARPRHRSSGDPGVSHVRRARRTHIQGGRPCGVSGTRSCRIGMGHDRVADRTVAASGYDVIVLDDNRRILLDHQHFAPS